MRVPEIEPLEPHLWFDEIAALGARIEALGEQVPDAVIRKAFYLAQLAPEPLRPLFGAELREDRLELLLDCEAHEQAALLLISPSGTFSLERAARADHFSAQITLLPDALPGRGVGHTAATALLAAWVACFSSLAELCSNSGPGPYRSRFEQPPQSTEH
jgi:hypothetical protein